MIWKRRPSSAAPHALLGWSMMDVQKPEGKTTAATNGARPSHRGPTHPRRLAVLGRLGLVPAPMDVVRVRLGEAFDASQDRAGGATVDALDAGCGKRSELISFRPRIRRLVGTDLHGPPPGLLPELDAFVSADLCGDTDAFAEGSFDIALSSYTTEHFAGPRRSVPQLPPLVAARRPCRSHDCQSAAPVRGGVPRATRAHPPAASAAAEGQLCGSASTGRRVQRPGRHPGRPRGRRVHRRPRDHRPELGSCLETAPAYVPLGNRRRSRGAAVPGSTLDDHRRRRRVGNLVNKQFRRAHPQRLSPVVPRFVDNRLELSESRG